MADDTQGQPTAEATTENGAKSFPTGCLLLVVIAIVLIAVVWLFGGSADGNPGGVVHMTLYDWKRGQSAEQYWRNNDEQMRLYNVSSYRYVTTLRWVSPDGTHDKHSAIIRFRVKATLQNGVPIEKLWDFHVFETIEEKWQISHVREAMP